jgi:hypothetical protein
MLRTSNGTGYHCLTRKVANIMLFCFIFRTCVRGFDNYPGIYLRYRLGSIDACIAK